MILSEVLKCIPDDNMFIVECNKGSHTVFAYYMRSYRDRCCLYRELHKTVTMIRTDKKDKDLVITIDNED